VPDKTQWGETTIDVAVRVSITVGIAVAIHVAITVSIAVAIHVAITVSIAVAIHVAITVGVAIAVRLSAIRRLEERIWYDTPRGYSEDDRNITVTSRFHSHSNPH
jgi:L-alanine-DL-glutamate epimerase-like enolase superfamily enzyme